MEFQENVISESVEEISDYANSFDDVQEIPKSKIKVSKSNKWSEIENKNKNKNFNKIWETLEEKTGINLSNQEENEAFHKKQNQKSKEE